MFRRRIVVRRPRLLGPAIVGGFGYALGRGRRPRVAVVPVPPVVAVVPVEPPDLTEKLKELSALHDSGALTDTEFAAAKRKLIGS